MNAFRIFFIPRKANSILMILMLLFLLSPVAQADAEPIHWYTYEEGMLAAGIHDKPMLLDFYADWCSPCIAMEKGTYPDDRVVSEMRDFVAIKVDTQKRIDIEKKYGVEYYPTVVLLDPEGREIARYIGYLRPEEMVLFIKENRGKSPKESPGFGEIPVLLALILLFRTLKGKIF